jgi:hypothetical protein
MTRFRAASQILSWVVIAIGVMTLLGWLFDVRTLTTVLPGLVTMKVNTAICFVLAGTALMLQDGQKVRSVLGKACAFGVMLVAGATLAEWVSCHDFGIDQLIVPGGAEPVAVFFLVECLQ